MIHTETILTPQCLLVSSVRGAGSGVQMNSISVSGGFAPKEVVAILDFFVTSQVLWTAELALSKDLPKSSGEES